MNSKIDNKNEDFEELLISIALWHFKKRSRQLCDNSKKIG